MKYVFDTSAIIVLLEVCKLNYQLKRFSMKNELLVPTTVAEEYLRGPRSETAIFKGLFDIVNVDLKRELLPYFNFDSSSGEFWVISYALEHADSCCVMDEEFGRNICRFFNLKLTGAMGVIEELKKQGFLSMGDLKNIRTKIAKSHFYLSKTLLRKLDRICLENRS